MKILQTPVRFYPFIGGVENYVYYLSKELVAMGHRVHVLCANEPPSRKQDIINGITLKRLYYLFKIANTNITPFLPLHILNEHFDLIHTHLPTPWSADWSFLTSMLKKKPLVLTYYNDIIGFGPTHHLVKIYNATLLQLLLKKAHKIIIIQDKYLTSSPYLGKYQDKIKVVPCGVDIEKFKPSESEATDNILFFLGLLDEFHKYKGLEYLLFSLKTVKKEIPTVKLIVGGNGNLLGYYEALANSIGIKDNVDFKGFIPDDELPDYYNKCQIFILPSISSVQEGFGIVALEALACGKPVISTDIIGIAHELENTQAGIVVPKKDVDALAAGIIKILKGNSSHEMGIRGRKLVEEKYTWKRVATMTEKIYQELL